MTIERQDKYKQAKRVSTSEICDTVHAQLTRIYSGTCHVGVLLEELITADEVLEGTVDVSKLLPKLTDIGEIVDQLNELQTELGAWIRANKPIIQLIE